MLQHRKLVVVVLFGGFIVLLKARRSYAKTSIHRKAGGSFPNSNRDPRMSRSDILCFSQKVEVCLPDSTSGGKKKRFRFSFIILTLVSKTTCLNVSNIYHDIQLDTLALGESLQKPAAGLVSFTVSGSQRCCLCNAF